MFQGITIVNQEVILLSGHLFCNWWLQLEPDTDRTNNPWQRHLWLFVISKSCMEFIEINKLLFSSCKFDHLPTSCIPILYILLGTDCVLSVSVFLLSKTLSHDFGAQSHLHPFADGLFLALSVLGFYFLLSLCRGTDTPQWVFVILIFFIQFEEQWTWKTRSLSPGREGTWI